MTSRTLPNVSVAERMAAWTGAGYRVVAQTETSAQLVRPKRFNPAEFVAMPLYLLEYLGQRDSSVYLQADGAGGVTETGTALQVSRYRRAQEQSGPVRLAIVVAGFAIVIALLMLLQAITK